MQTDFDVTIIGAGVVGLAIAARIAKSGKKVLVLETNDGIGQITSSRNSGVIHAGIYYPQNSLKAQTCVEGKKLLYDYVKRHKIPYKNLGKFIVSFASQIDRLQILMQKGINNGVSDLKLLEKKNHPVDISQLVKQNKNHMFPPTQMVNMLWMLLVK